jgi:hypothetical protein
MILKQEIIDKFFTLPRWAQGELFYCDMGWEYTGSDIMGWDYLHRPGAARNISNIYGVNPTADLVHSCLENGEEFGFDLDNSYRIPSSVRFYGRRIKDMFCRFEDDLSVDAELIGDKIRFSASFSKEMGTHPNVAIEDINIVGIGGDPLEAAFNLFVESVLYYEDCYIPTLSELSGIEDTFLDRNNEASIDFKMLSYVYLAYDTYKRFCKDIKNLPSGAFTLSDSYHTEVLHFKMRTVEGLVNIYSNYGKSIKVPSQSSGINGMTTGFSVGKQNTISQYNAIVLGPQNLYGNIPAQPVFNNLGLAVAQNKKGNVKWKKKIVN